MTTPKPRSAFIPIMLLIVGVVICAGVVLAFVPLVECDICLGMGSFTESPPDFNGWYAWTCDWCSERGVLTLFRKLTGNPDTDTLEMKAFFRRIKTDMGDRP